jgi:DNA repair photolyase
MGFNWSVNPYRGCAHGCHYCFARATHWYLDLSPNSDFSSLIFAKVNAPAVLRHELARRSWKREHVVVGTATDPYQQLEEWFRITRGLLEAFRDYRTPISIITKGSLMVRDIDLLVDMSKRADASVAFSVSMMDHDLWRKLEPGTPPPEKRLQALERLVKAGVPAGVMMAPLVPGITAVAENLEAVVRAAASVGANFVGTNVLYLKPGVKEHFMGFLEREYPELVRGYDRLYPGAYAPKEYQASLVGMVTTLQERFLIPERPATRATQRRASW